ncbi:MAG TPA: flagellar hook-basal body complex protein [Sphingomonas sp.]|jgi:flagellar hook protein FlgE|nr:flagellar hook-basal body complex protein [Sphingomonas sp.]
MFGSIYIGLSGLNAYSRGLQQVSNNVSNLNTTGFKSSTVSFRNLYGTSDKGGMALTGNGGSGGHGVTNGDAALDLKQGELRTTDRDLDLAVDGNGFLVLLDGTRTVYARTGSFQVDPDGYIVMAGTGYRLATLDAANRPVALSVDGQRTSVPKATRKIAFAGNLSSSATRFSVGNLTVYDANGAAHVWTATFTRDAATNPAWQVAVTDDKGAAIGTKSLGFTNGGVDPAAAKLEFADAASGLAVTLDFPAGVTSFSAGDVSTLRSSAIDGYASGTLVTVAVTDRGKLELAYSNGQKNDLGAVALADFRDPGALEQREGIFVRGDDGGDYAYMSSDDPRVGEIRSKRLEASNVDLSREFGDLILIQRGFQAASQIVSVSNDMIQQLFGIRGQG